MKEWNERKKEKKVAKKTLNDKTPPVPQREGKIGAHTQFDWSYRRNKFSL